MFVVEQVDVVVSLRRVIALPRVRCRTDDPTIWSEEEYVHHRTREKRASVYPSCLKVAEREANTSVFDEPGLGGRTWTIPYPEPKVSVYIVLHMKCSAVDRIAEPGCVRERSGCD